MSNVAAATLRAASVPRNAGYSSLSVYAHVGCGHDDRPSGLDRGQQRVDVALRVLAELVGVAGVEPRHAAAHLPSGSSHAKPLRSNTATAALPIAGSWYSTRHVGNSATVPAGRSRDAERRGRGRGTTSRTARGRTSAAGGRGRCR